MRERFSGGIFWLPFGPEVERDFSKDVKTICDGLGLRFEEYSASALQTALAERSVLVVLDDVWDLEHLKPFRVPSPGSCLLFTTRDKTIARSAGIVGQEVGALDKLQARSVLQRWSHREADLPEPQASEILEECGGLPLALSMIGAALAHEKLEEWDHLLRDLRRAKLKHVGAPLADYQYATIHAAIEVSIKAISVEIQNCYRSLAVMLEGTPVAAVILQTLWDENEDGAYRMMKVLVDRSLARRESAGIVLHDLQLKYLRDEHEYPEALDLQRAALRRSIHVVRDDPKQFASQMRGRLLAQRQLPGMSEFLDLLEDGEPYPRLRPLLPSLASPRDASVVVLDDLSWDAVVSVGLNWDGSKAVFASWRGLFCWEKRTNTIHRVEFEYGRCSLRVIGNRRSVFWCGHEEGALYSWDFDVDNPPILITRLNKSVGGFAINADATRAAFLSEHERSLAVYDISAGVAVLRRDSFEVSNQAFALSEDGRRLVIGCEDKLSVWDLDNLKELAVVTVHGKVQCEVQSVVMMPGGRQCLFSHGNSASTEVSLLDIDNHGSLRNLFTDLLKISSLCVSQDGKRVAGASYRGRILVCDLSRSNTVREYRGSDGDSQVMLAMSADGKFGFSARSNRRPCTLWDFDAPPSANHLNDCAAIAVTRNSQRAIALRKDGALTIWSLADEPEASTISGPPNSFGYHDVSISEDGTYALAGVSNKGSLRYLSTELDEAGLTLSSPELTGDFQCYENQFVLSCYGRRALTKLRNGPTVVWDFEKDRSQSYTLENSTNATALTLAADGEYGLLGMRDGRVNLWNLNKCEFGAVLFSHPSAVTQLRFVRTELREIKAFMSGLDDKPMPSLAEARATVQEKREKDIRASESKRLSSAGDAPHGENKAVHLGRTGLRAVAVTFEFVSDGFESLFGRSISREERGLSEVTQHESDKAGRRAKKDRGENDRDR